MTRCMEQWVIGTSRSWSQSLYISSTIKTRSQGPVREEPFMLALMTQVNTMQQRQGLKGHVELGPVVQSIVSLTSSLRGQLLKCITTL